MSHALPRPPPVPSLASAGVYAGCLERLEPDGSWRPTLSWLRRKRWVYLVAISDACVAATAVVEGGWFAGAFAWAVDRATGQVVLEASGAGLPGVHGQVSDRTGPGNRASFSSRALSVHVTRDTGGWIFDVEAAGGSIEASLDVDPASQPLTVVAPVPGAGLRATEKRSALPASGFVQVGDRTLSLAGGFGGVDVTAGNLARETSWKWAFATGSAGGVPLGFNLCEGFGVPRGDPGENALFRGALPVPLPPVEIQPGLAEWRIASADGAVDLVFRPAAAHAERRDLVVLRTRFTQLAGAFSGRIAGPGGSSLILSALPGVCEDHWALW